jgi:hypothetical protein
VPLTPDGSGTSTLGAPTVDIDLSGGPISIAYVPPGSPLFPTAAVLLSEYDSDVSVAYDVDGNGNPIPATRRVFVSNLTGAEGAVIDPVSGDFLASTLSPSNFLVREARRCSAGPARAVPSRVCTHRSGMFEVHGNYCHSPSRTLIRQRPGSACQGQDSQ